MKQFELIEAHVRGAVQWLKLGVEAVGAGVIGMGILMALGQLLPMLLRRRTANFTAVRLSLARYLALALEFQLGADILSTAIAPSWQQIGQLGAIAVIRTVLNVFLSKEMREEQASVAEEHVVSKTEQP
ncbi:DUF1622 domain-containing protein [Hymenobacter busanensis]|uniref:DUF1622 domain-containing protein n=1 Tax=Hymenobacter busanensis TaxID=2607656 RepID=A0A7L4ZTI9_9BACT|nr:DUF1622 domain-containing protein [Hymenobacter busanensis]KAA9327527.1 DUF1622 domain-containing protein [Hymenobacter busanensis]QHJ06135.1 DUF1622 domain-containing protein [Hymenobacter busanensis]